MFVVLPDRRASECYRRMYVKLHGAGTSECWWCKFGNCTVRGYYMYFHHQTSF